MQTVFMDGKFNLKLLGICCQDYMACDLMGETLSDSCDFSFAFLPSMFQVSFGGGDHRTI